MGTYEREATTQATLDGKHEGPSLPVQIHRIERRRTDEYGREIWTNETPKVTLQCDEPTEVQVAEGTHAGTTVQVYPGEGCPLPLFETYEKDIDQEIYKAQRNELEA
jgi:hypothetical protein